MAETRYRAWTRTVDPMTKQPTLLGGAWVPGSPAAEIVAWVLTTPLGGFQPDPARGVDYAALDRASPEAPARLAAAITAALAFAVDDGTVGELAVEAEGRGAVMLAEVSFVDPRDTSRRRQRRVVRV